MQLANSFGTTFREIDPRPPYASKMLHMLYAITWHARLASKGGSGLEDLERWLQEQLLEDSKPYGLGQSMVVPRVRAGEIGQRAFRTIYRNCPLVVEGLLADTEAVRTWSLDCFKQQYGNDRLPVAKQYDTDGVPYEDMTLAALVDSVRSGTAKRHYLMASATLFASHPDLLRQLDIQRLADFSGKMCIRAEIFMGGKENGSPFHCASSGNLFCNVHGEKSWVLVAPQHSMWMYPQIGKNKLAVYVNSPVFSDRAEEIEQRFPLFRYVPKYTVHLKPGDVLYVPPWWWHEVTNHGETIGVPVRFLDDGGGNLPFSLLMVTMAAVSPGSVKQLLPVASQVFKRSLRGAKGFNDLYLGDELTAASHVSSRLYERGWRRFLSEQARG